MAEEKLWAVNHYRKVPKNLKKLPKEIVGIQEQLEKEIMILGPERTNWPNYGKIRGKENRYHCHLKKGNPTYVSVWEIISEPDRIIEVIYVGTHEKAPY